MSVYVEDQVLERILAYEYGRLDAKYDMGYDPPPRYKASYTEGYRTQKGNPAPEPIPIASYANKQNWGWY